MFIKNGNIKEFGIEVRFQKFMEYLDEIEEEFISIDISGVVNTTLYLHVFSSYINKNIDKKQLKFDDISEQGNFVFINLQDIRKIVCGEGIFCDQYILILKHNIMYRLERG